MPFANDHLRWENDGDRVFCAERFDERQHSRYSVSGYKLRSSLSVSARGIGQHVKCAARSCQLACLSCVIVSNERCASSAADGALFV